jgi:hypothetical protein
VTGNRYFGGFQVLTAADMKTVFWVVAPCSLVKSTDDSEVPAASIISRKMLRLK